MRDSDEAKFGALLRDVMAFYKQDVSPFAASVWWTSCEGFDFDQVSNAMSAHAMDPDRGQFPPKPADIVRQLGGTKTDASLRAWSKVHSAMSDVGAYQDVVFDDPVIHRVVEDLGGWPKLCRTPIDDLSYVQHRFCESYRAFHGKNDFPYPRALGGDRSEDGMYAKRGLPAPKPVLIGNQDDAMRVYLNSPSKANSIANSVKSAMKLGISAK